MVIVNYDYKSTPVVNCLIKRRRDGRVPVTHVATIGSYVRTNTNNERYHDADFDFTRPLGSAMLATSNFLDIKIVEKNNR